MILKRLVAVGAREADVRDVRLTERR